MPASRSSAASTVLSAVLGVVLLAGVVAFTVGLNAADDTEPASSETAAGAIDLPDSLSNGMVAVDLGTLPEELTAQLGSVDELPAQEAAVAEGLARVFGVPGEFRVYAAEDATALANVTVLDKAPGLFTPDTLPIDPSVIGVTRAQSELVDVDGATCSVAWPAEVPEGQEIDPTVTPQAVRCQLGAGERTYEITAQGLTVDDSVAVLKALAA